MNKRNSNCLARFVNLLQPLRGTGEWLCARSGRCWVLALFLLVVMLLSATTRPVSCEPQVVGLVEALYSSNATLVRDGETSSISLGMQLLSGDRVTTGANGGPVNIVLAEGALIVMAEDTSIIMNSYTADRARPWLLTHKFELVKGRIEVVNSLSGPRIEMRAKKIVVRATRRDARFADGFFDLWGISKVVLEEETVSLPEGKGLLVSPNGNFSICDGIPPALMKWFPRAPSFPIPYRNHPGVDVKVRVYRDMNEIVFDATGSTSLTGSLIQSVWWDIREGNIEPVPSLFGPVLRVKAKPGKLRVCCEARGPYGYALHPEIVIAVSDEAVNRPPILKTDPDLLALTRHPFCPEALAEDPEGHPVKIGRAHV